MRRRGARGARAGAARRLADRRRGTPRRLVVAVVGVALLLLASCGGGSGGGPVVVHVYADAGACGGARAALGRYSGEGIRVRLSCLPPAAHGGRLDLARVGANARRAAEDSAAVAYISGPGRAPRLASSILEAAAIPHLVDPNPTRAMRQFLTTLESTDPDTAIRASLNEELG